MQKQIFGFEIDIATPSSIAFTKAEIESHRKPPLIALKMEDTDSELTQAKMDYLEKILSDPELAPFIATRDIVIQQEKAKTRQGKNKIVLYIEGHEAIQKALTQIFYRHPDIYPMNKNADFFYEIDRVANKEIYETIDKQARPFGGVVSKLDMLPPKGKRSSDFEVVDEPKKTDQYSTSPVTKAKRAKRDVFFVAKRPMASTAAQRHEAIQVEAFYGELSSLYSQPNTVAKTRSFHDETSKVGTMVLSKEIRDRRTLLQLVLEQKPIDEYLKKLAPFLVDAYCAMENDLSLNNICITTDGELKRFDFGQAGWPFTCIYAPGEGNPSKDCTINRLAEVQVKPKDAFPITAQDIIDFPRLHDAKPNNWLCRSDWERKMDRKPHLAPLDDIASNPDFIKEKYFYFLKRALISPKTIEEIGKNMISNELAIVRAKHVSAQKMVANTLWELLPTIKQFREYFLKFKDDYRTQIINQYKQYNAQFEAKNSYTGPTIEVDGLRYKKKYAERLVDIAEINNKFDEMANKVNLQHNQVVNPMH